MSLHPQPHKVVTAFMRNTRPPNQAQLDALATRWVSGWALAGAPGTGEFGIGFARADVSERRFEFSDTGSPAMAVIALNDECRAADIVAWGLRSEFIASWIGAVSMLGRQHVLGPRIMSDALPIFSDPLTWLRGDRQGIVLIDERRAAAELQDAGPFLAMGGVQHGDKLERLLTPPKPAIWVPPPSAELRAA